MRLTKERLKESYDLISKHLVKSHDDKDENSLFVRFSEIIGELEYLKYKSDVLQHEFFLRKKL